MFTCNRTCLRTTNGDVFYSNQYEVPICFSFIHPLTQSRSDNEPNGSERIEEPYESESERTIFERANVVGITCSTAKSILEGCPDGIANFGTFPIVLFDDSSRVIEHMGLICLRLAMCSAMVSTGDPRQLLPILFTTDKPVTRGGKECKDGIGVTLFGHVAERGVAPLLLRTQYRCSRYMESIASKLFYDDAIKKKSRGYKSSVLPFPGLPSLAVVDTQESQEEETWSGDWKNTIEANKIAETIHLLVTSANVTPSSICVIAMFRDQLQTVFALVPSYSHTCGP